MQLKQILFLALSLTSFNICAESASYVDLSHAYAKDTINWPSTQPFKVTHQFAGSAPAGHYVAVRDYASNEHAGTHIDAPLHFAKGHGGVSDIKLEQLIGPAVKVDVSVAASQNRDHLISVEDFQRWEKEHGQIPDNSIVLLSTGFGKFWPNRKLYTGTSKSDEKSTTQLHFPGLDPKAAAWLVEERHIKAVGIDTLSIDRGQSKQFESHQLLTKHDIPIFENVAEMSDVPGTNFTVYALPMKISGGTGAPLRIVAVIGSPS